MLVGLIGTKSIRCLPSSERSAAAPSQCECDVADRSEIDNVVALSVAVRVLGHLGEQRAGPRANGNSWMSLRGDPDHLAFRHTRFLHHAQAAFPHLKLRGGSVVNLGSNAALQSSPLYGAYAIARVGTRALSRVATREWGS